MNTSEGVADLHLHTTASDGTCSVEERIRQSQELALEAIAITDHDTIADYFSQRVSNQNNLELITGVEVRADVLDTKVELLGYYVDPLDENLLNLLEKVRSYRRDRNRKIIDQLQMVSNLDRSYDEVRTNVKGILGRPHIANVLIDAGIVDSVGMAFEIYLGSDGEAFVPMKRVPAEEVIETIQDAGGVVSFAHPGRVRTDSIETILEELVADGLDAIEVPYPYDEAPSEGYADVTSEDASEFAEKYNLLTTGGSDCHGPNSGKYRIGEVRITSTQLEALRKRANEHRQL
ncbi:PHP domain-containing protein [Haloferax sp. MBLA0076]|uniref:PHP domain-containing protein n=1 Tax=Haloferax litoreum TaxID=2666140 RepID=A0A6A8GEG3_9EURY|nr:MULTISPECIES: PHP domain-containing protein [Haloferax]KAB1192755.1 PHP domain-containing protein [Haloferax sp. CBA1148]MRX21236.1 PHP domain-containing protein [Haloferax litoreum]